MTTSDNVANFFRIFSTCLSYRVSVIGMNKYLDLLNLVNEQCTSYKITLLVLFYKNIYIISRKDINQRLNLYIYFCNLFFKKPLNHSSELSQVFCEGNKYLNLHFSIYIIYMYEKTEK